MHGSHNSALATQCSTAQHADPASTLGPWSQCVEKVVAIESGGREEKSESMRKGVAGARRCCALGWQLEQVHWSVLSMQQGRVRQVGLY